MLCNNQVNKIIRPKLALSKKSGKQIDKHFLKKIVGVAVYYFKDLHHYSETSKT